MNQLWENEIMKNLEHGRKRVGGKKQRGNEISRIQIAR